MAKSRRKRAGRSRKDGPRYPGGQRQTRSRRHENVGPTGELLEKRAAGGVGATGAMLPDAGTYIGRLFLTGKITQGQRDAAYRWQQWQREYQFFIAGPHQPKAADLDMPKGSPPPDDPRKYKRVRDQLLFCYRAAQRRGINVLRATVYALADEPQARIDWVIEGLEAVRKALRIGEQDS